MKATPESEADFVKKLIKVLRKLPECWAVKIHGDMYQERGIPDIIGCYKRQSFVIEAKRKGKRGNVSRFQQKHLDEFHRAGAISLVAETVDEVLEAIGAV